MHLNFIYCLYYSVVCVHNFSLSLLLAHIDSFCQGPVGAAGLYSPEAQIANSPLIIGYLNGIVSLVDRGLTRCCATAALNFEILDNV